MLEEILRHLNNWFCVEVHEGEFSVENGSISLPFLQYGQYYRICGSVRNDGLHQYTGPDSDATELLSESWTGTVWALAIPADVLRLVKDVEAWQEKNAEAAQSPYQSESFGGYSYTKASGNADSGGSVSWQSVFRSRLNCYRKIRGCEP